ncbi:m-phase inducer phosphatase [Parahypoxylon ruwenzoriense]
MDSSSPLAAMRAPPATDWGHSPNSHLPTGNPFGAGNPGIRDHLQRSMPDYFNLKSIRGSSPGASLAADLSQNFRLDNEESPRFPTPRRALFTSNMMEAMENRGYITTPPMPATSSPARMSDAMDISPLPRKGAFFDPAEMTSPTRVESLDDDMMMDSPVAITRQASVFLDPSKMLFDNRRRAGLRRPSLTRTKGHSGSTPMATSPSDCFEDSPVQERRPQTARSPSPTNAGTSRSKPQFGSLTGTRDVRNGPPTPSHARRLSNPFSRARRQYRRSISMFDNPGDVMKTSAEDMCPQNALHSVTDMEESQDPLLPHFFEQDDSIPRITRDTFVDILDGKFNKFYTQKMVIDCRFEYEYDGGHIMTAVNCNNRELLAQQLLENPMDGRTLLIFHCEYSACRAPMMARHIRALDRAVNAEFYPKLTYPEMYILDGGYSQFFIEHRERCHPQAYVAMDAEEHTNTCEREMGKLQQKRKGFNRAKTFAFGQRDAMIDDSPTGPERHREHQSPIMMIGNSPILGNNRSPARRMASY